MRLVFASLVLVLAQAGAAAPVDMTRIGPAVGAPAPSFSLIDQNGRTHSLASLAGPEGTMLVFFRSADW